MNEIVLGLGDYAVSKESNSIIKTYALGSCVAVITYDLEMKIAGMVHIVLPNESLVQDKRKAAPSKFKLGYFADTGIAVLLREMKQLGSSGKILIKLVGGAHLMDSHYKFNVGKRNVLAVKKFLWNYRLGVLVEDVGGTISRTVQISVNTGQVIVSNPDKGQWQV